MARITLVKKARKYQGKCRVCGKEINIGDTYKWAKPRYGGKIIVCEKDTISRSMLSSSKMVTIYDEVDAIRYSSVEEVVDNLRQFAETVRGVGEEYQESADNQREFFPDSSVADENEEKAQELDGWADEIDSNADSAEQDYSELEELQAELESDETDEERKQELETLIESKQEDITSYLDIIDECPF